MKKHQISNQAKKELVGLLKQRYKTATKKEKTNILDEFIALSGFHRKHAIRILNQSDTRLSSKQLYSHRIYTEGVLEALIVIWEAADRICGKRLKSVLPAFVVSMEKNGHLHLDPDGRQRLLSISPATI